MKILRIIIISLTLLPSLALNLPVFAQQSILTRIENAGRGTKWRLTKWHLSRSNKLAWYSWVSGNSHVFALVFLLESSEENAKEFNLYTPVGSDEADMKVLGSSAVNLGDENFLFENRYGNKNQGVVFRKGRVLVQVEASSLKEAEQLALYIADAIPAA
jgi:hypothetical protein